LKTGIFGGTFNPVHNGHLRSAEEAREMLELDRIIFMPCHLPPHKEADDIVPGGRRTDMLELAVKGNPHFEISDMELKRGGKSYSIETLRELKRIHGDSEELFFIIGTDSFVELRIWRDYSGLFAMTNFIVVARPGYMDSIEKENPVELLPVDIQADFCYDSQSRFLRHKSGRVIYFLETSLLDISSTSIRNKVSHGLSIRYLVPPAVERLIKEKSLYITGK